MQYTYLMNKFIQTSQVNNLMPHHLPDIVLKYDRNQLHVSSDRAWGSVVEFLTDFIDYPSTRETITYTIGNEIQLTIFRVLIKLGKIDSDRLIVVVDDLVYRFDKNGRTDVWPDEFTIWDDLLDYLLKE